jgi:hypothetical protein
LNILGAIWCHNYACLKRKLWVLQGSNDRLLAQMPQ